MTEDLRKKCLSIHDFIPEAMAGISPESWDCVIGGTEAGTTLACGHAVGPIELI